MRDEALGTRAATDLRPDEAAWSTFIVRWTLFTALALVGAFVAFGALLAAAGDAPMGDIAVFELVGASRSPVLHRVVGVFDVLVWLGTCGALLGFAGLFAPFARRRAALLAACGVGQLAGAVGAYMRLGAVNELAGRYAAAAPDQQAALVQAQLTLFQIISAHFSLGQLLNGAGFLLLASAGLSLVGFPRWLAIWFGLSGLYAVGAQLVFAAGSTTLQPVFPLYAIVGLIAPFIAVAVAFSRRVPVLTAATP